MNVREINAAHLVGIGGINMSAVAKILKLEARSWNLEVSGSDVATNEQTEILAKMEIPIAIGHAATNVPKNCDLLITSSAVPPTNPEREEARRRGIREMTNFGFLGEWFAEKKVIVVAGTHGKSTTTAMLGLILEAAGMDPTVIVGSKVPTFSDGNLRIGTSDLVVIEGDEYAKHFLAFHPFGLVLNNIELDHTDVFPTIAEMKAAFRELVGQVRKDGFIVANMEDANVREILAGDRISVRSNIAPHPESFARPVRAAEIQSPASDPSAPAIRLSVPGRFNLMNAAGAATAARELGASEEAIASALESFKGIWRRFEFLGEKNGARVYSDYGHHPTAVAATLEAAKEVARQRSKAGSRVLLCFQPHHRNRTKHLFLDFVTSFDLADVLVLCEIYDVAGRDAAADENVTSHDLVDAVTRHDADRGVSRVVEYSPNPGAAVSRIMELAKPDDIVIVMGAGDIDDAIRMSFPRKRESSIEDGPPPPRR